MSRLLSVVIALFFVVLGAAFIVPTVTFVYEYQALNWFDIAVFYSHSFIFFVTFGLVGLIAFYRPTCVALELYWRHIAYGRLTVIALVAAIAAGTVFITAAFQGGSERSIWEVSPHILAADRGEPAGCQAGSGAGCQRQPVLRAFSEVIQASRERLGMSPFVRACKPDPLLETPQEMQAERYCFASGRKSNAADCCLAQGRLVTAVNAMQAGPGGSSLTRAVHAYTLHAGVCFFLLLLAVGIMLARNRQMVDEKFPGWGKSVERGILIGAVAMVFWPVMNQAFLQSVAVLYGHSGHSVFRLVAPLITLVFGGWALMLLLFFYRNKEKMAEQATKYAGVAASTIAVLKYNDIVNYSVRAAGSGATMVTIGALILVAFIGIFSLRVIHAKQPFPLGARAIEGER